jgi:predicted transcriptional regulator
MLRSIHPEQEAAAYEVAWFGAKWREADWAGPVVLIPRNRSPQTMQEALEAALTDQPQSVSTLASAAGLSYAVARQGLEKLVGNERAQRVTIKAVVWKRTRDVVRYVRASA